MDGLETCAHFSYMPCALGYCGPRDASALFSQFLKTGDGVDAARAAIARFEGLYPYLVTIAAAHGKDPLDRAVVEAYWLGNSLLDSLSRADACAVLDLLVTRGLPARLAEEVKARLPARPLLSHAFHVLFVGPGNTTHTVQPTLQVKDSCLVSFGTVVEVVDDQHLIVSRRPLRFTTAYGFGAAEPFTVLYEKKVFSPQQGDLIAMHWGYAVMRLDAERQERLLQYTSRVLADVNAYLVASP